MDTVTTKKKYAALAKIVRSKSAKQNDNGNWNVECDYDHVEEIQRHLLIDFASSTITQ